MAPVWCSDGTGLRVIFDLARSGRAPRHRPAGDRWHLALIAASSLLGLPSCGVLPAPHYALTTLPFSSEQGWVPLPTARWLVNPGIQPDAMLFCPPERCGPPAFVARIELSGHETGFADLLISDPVRALSAVKPTPNDRGNRSVPVSRAAVAPLALAGWAGGLVRIEARQTRGGVTAKAAHVALIARRDGQRAVLFMAVAPTSETAIGHLRRATQ